MSSTATTIEFNSVNSSVSQQVTCIADRNTFVNSTNPTYSNEETPRITEIGLFDATGNLIAIAKTNRTYYKSANDIVIFNVIIDY
jgi:exosome complex RNA-binding protein Rrp4